MILFFFELFFFISLSMSSSIAVGQTNRSPHIDLGATVGPFLTENLPGVSQILPAYSAFISKGVQSFRPELGLVHGRSEGDIYYMAMLSVRNTYTFDDLEPFWYLGLDYSLYRPTMSGRIYPYRGQGGWHYGGGLLISVSQNIQIRTEVMGRVRPGKALYVGIGLCYSFKSSDQPGQGPAK